MGYWTALTQQERNRMCYVTIGCSEEKCMAVRGEPCRALTKSKRSKTPGFTDTPHYWRRTGFTEWKKHNPEKYAKLEAQILAERITEEDCYETCPA